MVLVAAKNSSQVFGISTPAFSKVVALKKKTRPVVETESPCSTPFIDPASRSVSAHCERSSGFSWRRSAKPSPFLENSGSHGQLT
ncbi:hypothetical protein D3C71_2042650 [compost metagenome]